MAPSVLRLRTRLKCPWRFPSHHAWEQRPRHALERSDTPAALRRQPGGHAQLGDLPVTRRPEATAPREPDRQARLLGQQIAPPSRSLGNLGDRGGLLLGRQPPSQSVTRCGPSDLGHPVDGQDLAPSRPQDRTCSYSCSNRVVAVQRPDRAGVAGQVVRRLADQPGKRDQRSAGKHKQRQLVDGAEPIQNHHQRRQQQRRQERTASDVPTGPAHPVTLVGGARRSADRGRDRELVHHTSSGRSRTRQAVAWCIALATALAMPTAPGLPMGIHAHRVNDLVRD